MTSGDYNPPVSEPLVVFPPGADAVAPAEARYVVKNAPAGTAFFSGISQAMGWQQAEGGNIRTV